MLNHNRNSPYIIHFSKQNSLETGSGCFTIKTSKFMTYTQFFKNSNQLHWFLLSLILCLLCNIYSHLLLEQLLEVTLLLFVFLCHFWWYPLLSSSFSHPHVQPTKFTLKKSNFFYYFFWIQSHFKIGKHEEESRKVTLLVRFQQEIQWISTASQDTDYFKYCSKNA